MLADFFMITFMLGGLSVQTFMLLHLCGKIFMGSSLTRVLKTQHCAFNSNADQEIVVKVEENKHIAFDFETSWSICNKLQQRGEKTHKNMLEQNYWKTIFLETDVTGRQQSEQSCNCVACTLKEFLLLTIKMIGLQFDPRDDLMIIPMIIV